MEDHNKIPIEGYKELEEFHFLLLSKILRPDLFVNKLKNFINSTIGEYYSSNLVYTLTDIFKESNPSIPLIFILSPGNDPLESIK